MVIKLFNGGIFTAPIIVAFIDSVFSINISNDTIEVLFGIWIVIAICWFFYRWNK